MIINKIKSKFIFFFLLLQLSACQLNQHHPIKRQLFVFGTVIDINIWTDNEELAAAAVTEISEKFTKIHSQWHAWKPGRLNSINQLLRQGETVRLNDEESFVLKRSIDLSQLSKGHFNPLMGEVINLWGFHSDVYPLTSPPPAKATIQNLLQNAPQLKDIIFNDDTIHSNNPHIWFDLGGVAKGYAVDIAIQILQKHNIHHAIVNAGGDLRAFGKKDNLPWTIAIQSPKNWEPLALIKVNGSEAIFTSGNYQRYKAFDGKRYAHIINPHNYQPVSEIISATVIAHDGMLADAAATALVVAGKRWANVARQMGIHEALVIDESDRCFATRSMFNRLSEARITCEITNPSTGGL